MFIFHTLPSYSHDSTRLRYRTENDRRMLRFVSQIAFDSNSCILAMLSFCFDTSSEHAAASGPMDRAHHLHLLLHQSWLVVEVGRLLLVRVVVVILTVVIVVHLLGTW